MQRQSPQFAEYMIDSGSALGLSILEPGLNSQFEEASKP